MPADESEDHGTPNWASLFIVRKRRHIMRRQASKTVFFINLLRIDQNHGISQYVRRISGGERGERDIRAFPRGVIRHGHINAAKIDQFRVRC